MNGKRCLFLFSAAVAGLPAHAETTQCTPIAALPAVVDQQGVYCLTGHLSTSQTSGNAILITAPNVTLDLNGWKLGGLAAGSGTSAKGIASLGWIDNITIKNGTVRGFNTAIHLIGRGTVVRGLSIEQNTVAGISISGEGASIEHNRVINTGGQTAYPDMYAVGIELYAVGSTVKDNVVSGLISVSGRERYEMGIYVGTSQCLIENNFVTDDGPPADGITNIGIHPNGSGIILRTNTVANFEDCIWYSQSIPAATGIYSNNTAMGCTTAFFGGTDGGGNANTPP